MLDDLKAAFHGANRTKKLQILSVCPYSIEKTKAFFETSYHMVNTARSLKKDYGVLPDVPTMSKGKKITEDEKQKVTDFFEDDSVSRQCPGKKDCISVREPDGSKVQKQNRLVLSNLKEAYELFKDRAENPKIGFSTFCSLRPKHCKLAGSSGTHSVCVCTYHQNPKLQLNAIGEPGLTLEDVMGKAVCDMMNDSCMRRECQTCPGKDGVMDFLKALPSMEDRDEFRYKRWVTVDRCTLQEVVESEDEFVDTLSTAVIKLLRHHYVSQKQSRAFKVAKESLDVKSAVLVGDFAENHSFLVQDAAQGFHWDNSQCTVHPFVLYFKDSSGAIGHKSYCFISDCTKHSTAMVHTFQKVLIPVLKENHPSLTEIIYFSDGCAGQYKNRFNFINLLYHEADFGVKAQWNFFATSHGKNACDGIGGTLKRSVTRASLQRPYTDQILTAKAFFDYCQDNISSIRCFYVDTKQVETVTKELEARFEMALTVQGTQKHHHFSPIGSGQLEISEVSDVTSPRKQVRICRQEITEPLVNIQSQPIVAGSYVVVKDNSKNWVAYVDHKDEEYGDYFIRFLHPHGIQVSYTFPDNGARLFKDESNIIGILPIPTIRSSLRMKYSFPMQILKGLMRSTPE